MDQRIHHEISQLVPFNMILQQPRGGTQSTGLKKFAQKRAAKRWEKNIFGITLRILDPPMEGFEPV